MDWTQDGQLSIYHLLTYNLTALVDWKGYIWMVENSHYSRSQLTLSWDHHMNRMEVNYWRSHVNPSEPLSAPRADTTPCYHRWDVITRVIWPLIIMSEWSSSLKAMVSISGEQTRISLPSGPRDSWQTRCITDHRSLEHIYYQMTVADNCDQCGYIRKRKMLLKTTLRDKTAAEFPWVNVNMENSQLFRRL